MKGIVREFYCFKSQTAHFVVLPLFYLLFVLLFNPFALCDYLDMGRDLAQFNLLMLTSIIFLVTLVTRIVLWLLRDAIHLTVWHYLLWVAAELLLCSAFCALYLSLMAKEPFFSKFVMCIGELTAILIFPYAILALFLTVKGLLEGEGPDDGSIVKFRDETQKLRFAVSAADLLYVEAHENYAHVFFVDNGRVRQQKIRSTMKRLEEVLERHGLVRCQRAYIVNPPHVKNVRRDEAGFVFADLDTPGTPAIPVSRTYYDRLTSIL